MIQKIVKDVYRDSPIIVFRSSPLDIVKKSKRCTRTLHAEFSFVLWVHAAVFYFVNNYLLNTHFMVIPPIQLILIIAAVIECSVEVYLCKKEVEVLNEKITLRQINPANIDSDVYLKCYQKQLTKKIRIILCAILLIVLLGVFLIIHSSIST